MPTKKKKELTAISKNRLYLFIAFCIISLLSCLISILPSPERATILGFGIDAPMTQFVFEQDKFTINYPKSWNLHLTPDGNHGDNDVIALILVPLHSLPKITFFRKVFANDDLSNVINWREERLKDSNGYKFIAQSSFSFGNSPGENIEYTRNSKSLLGDAIIRCKDVIFSQNSVGHIISFCAYASDWEKLENTFNRVIFSINYTE
jgi:hypothetical protein